MNVNLVIYLVNRVLDLERTSAFNAKMDLLIPLIYACKLALLANITVHGPANVKNALMGVQFVPAQKMIPVLNAILKNIFIKGNVKVVALMATMLTVVQAHV